MAKTPVKIEIDGYKEREVQMVTYEFDQATDTEGQMSGIPRGGKIVVRVKALNDGTTDLLEWMMERILPNKGKMNLNETTDVEGQISGIPRGGKVTIRVKAMNDGNNQLLQWMLAPNDPRDMKVTFENTVDGSTMKTLEGTGCYCIHYTEKWEDGQEHYEEIEVVCQTLKKSPVEYNNPWK